MFGCSTLDLEAIEASIESQTEAVARAPSTSRYVEILRLQMLREMRDILAEAYRFSSETADLFRELTQREGEPEA